MSCTAVVAPRPIRRFFQAPTARLTASKSTCQFQPKRASRLAVVPEQKKVAQETPAVEPKLDTENGVPGEIPSCILPVGAPVRMGRARSNSFYGRAQHTVLALRRSPPPPSPPSLPSPTSPTSSASSSESSFTSDESACRAPKTATFEPTSVPAALARTAQRLDLNFPTSASGLIGRSVAACLGSSSGLQLDTRPTTSLCISVSTTTTTTSAPASSPPHRDSPLLPACPERTQAQRDSRCRLVAGMLLNRSARAKQPAAKARAHRRAFWESASYASVNGVRCSSGLRYEVDVC